MKKILFIFSLIFVFHYLSRDSNSFNLLTKEISCDNNSTCWHEIGHSLDAEHAQSLFMFWQWQSSQIEFQNAVNKFLEWCEIPTSETSLRDQRYCLLIINFPGINNNLKREVYDWKSFSTYSGGWGGNVELYASLLSFSDGNVEHLPDSLQKFYNQEEINNIVLKYNKDNYVTIN